jgi:uncharacterized BrkB/YihY/UPF0761 family membrane protein
MLKGADRPREGIVATVIGVGTLVFAAVGVVVQLKDALNTVWEPTQGFHSRAVYRNRKSGRIVYRWTHGGHRARPPGHGTNY